MARTPSMTVAEAEAAIGARGKIVVTAEKYTRLLRKYEEAKDAAGEEVSDQAFETNETIQTAASSGNGHANGDATALLEMLRKAIGSSVDANQVREIVDATIKDKAK